MSQDTYANLLKSGAHLVLARADKRAVEKSWQKRPPPLQRVLMQIKNGGLLGLIPASMDTLCVDVDKGDPQLFIRRFGKPFTLYKTRKGWHLWYRAFGWTCGNKSLHEKEYGISGDLRSANGYAILWGDHTQFLNDYNESEHGVLSDSFFALADPDLPANDDIADAMMILSATEKGDRHNTFRDLVFRLAREGYTREDLEPLLKVGMENNEDTADVRRTFNDALKAGSEGKQDLTTDDFLLDQWLKQFPDRLYDRDDGMWFAFEKSAGHWIQADDQCAREMNLVARQLIGQAKGKVKQQLRSAFKHTAQSRVLGMAKNWRMSVSTRDGQTFDKHNHLLGIPTGVMDLKTGTSNVGEPSMRIRRMVAVEPDLDTEPKLFEAFLQTALDRDQDFDCVDLAVFGLYLNGRDFRREFFVYSGSEWHGQNHVYRNDQARDGSVRHDHVGGLVGRCNGLRTTLNGLRLWMVRGRFLVVRYRLVRSGNTEIMNAFTGGDEVEANKMKENSVPFRPVGKLVIAGNHRPSFRSGDGIVRRMRLIPFNAVQTNPDLQFASKLKAESTAILGRMVREAVEYYHEGMLDLPDSVVMETRTYVTESDPVEGFLESCCTFGQDFREKVSDVRAAFGVYCYRERLKEPKVSDWYRLLEHKYGLERKVLVVAGGTGERAKHWTGVRINDDFVYQTDEVGEDFREEPVDKEDLPF